MSENLDELKAMLQTFRVSELQMILGYAGRNKSGRKTELQARAIELLRVRSHPIQTKIRELYKSIATDKVPKTNAQRQKEFQQRKRNQQKQNRQNGGLNNPNQSTTPSPPASLFTMPQPQGNLPRATATVNPYSAQMNTRQAAAAAAVYNQTTMYTPHYTQYTNPQSVPPQSHITNPSPSLVSQQQQQQGGLGSAVTGSNYPVHPDVKFKRLPFFDVLSDLLRPSTLMPQTNGRMQDGHFQFHLSPQQATDVASSRDIRHGSKFDYSKQVQMRFCLLETTCEQEDFFPPQLVVKVNNKLAPLPNPVPTNKPGVEPKRPPKPVNITPYIKLSPTVANNISVQWAADYGRGYAVTIALVHKRNSTDLLQRLKNRGAKNSDYTRSLIKEKLNDDADSEIATTCLRVSLMCPLGKMRMSTPCRASTCQHLQCFDASLYLQMNERKATWNCPVCDKTAIYDTLVIDGYFQEVLNSPVIKSDTHEIQLHKDGSWSVHTNEKKGASGGGGALLSSTQSQKIESLDDSVQIISDDIEMVEPLLTTTAIPLTSLDDIKPKDPDDATSGKVNKSVVDLTLSDSEDDEPLAKRRTVHPPKPDSTNVTTAAGATTKFSDTTSISSSSNLSSSLGTPTITTGCGGPSSVSSSGYPASPAIITLDSPSPPPQLAGGVMSPPSPTPTTSSSIPPLSSPSPSSSSYAAHHMLSPSGGGNGVGGYNIGSPPVTYGGLEGTGEGTGGGVTQPGGNCGMFYAA